MPPLVQLVAPRCHQRHHHQYQNINSTIAATNTNTLSAPRRTRWVPAARRRSSARSRTWSRTTALITSCTRAVRPTSQACARMWSLAAAESWIALSQSDNMSAGSVRYGSGVRTCGTGKCEGLIQPGAGKPEVKSGSWEFQVGARGRVWGGGKAAPLCPSLSLACMCIWLSLLSMLSNNSKRPKTGRGKRVRRVESLLMPCSHYGLKEGGRVRQGCVSTYALQCFYRPYSARGPFMVGCVIGSVLYSVLVDHVLTAAAR
eukprot:343245-Chlamydomonas_euryale.AAC.3